MTGRLLTHRCARCPADRVYDESAIYVLAGLPLCAGHLAAHLREVSTPAPSTSVPKEPQEASGWGRTEIARGARPETALVVENISDTEGHLLQVRYYGADERCRRAMALVVAALDMYAFIKDIAAVDDPHAFDHCDSCRARALLAKIDGAA